MPWSFMGSVKASRERRPGPRLPETLMFLFFPVSRHFRLLLLPPTPAFISGPEFFLVSLATKSPPPPPKQNKTKRKQKTTCQVFIKDNNMQRSVP